MDTVKVVILSLLILAVLVIAGFVVLSTLRTTEEEIQPTQSGSVTNETITASDSGTATAVVSQGLRNIACTAVLVHNNTNQVIQSGNYTFSSDCYLTNLTSEFPGRPWNITYTYKYDFNDTNYIVSNFMNGTKSWFAYVPTIFVLLAIVVIVLVIGLVIVIVSRFSTGAAISSKSEEGSLENI